VAVPKWYANGLLSAMNGNATAGLNVDLDTDTIKLILLTSSYTPAQTTHATSAMTWARTRRRAARAIRRAASRWRPRRRGDVAHEQLGCGGHLAGDHGGPFAFRYGAYYKARVARRRTS
jgi:hypothetical protein